MGPPPRGSSLAEKVRPRAAEDGTPFGTNASSAIPDMTDFVRQTEMQAQTERVIAKQATYGRAVSMVELNNNEKNTNLMRRLSNRISSALSFLTSTAAEPEQVAAEADVARGSSSLLSQKKLEQQI